MLCQPAPSLVIHADRDSQYTSLAYCQRIIDVGAVISYDRVTPMVTHRRKPAAIPWLV